MTPLGGPGSERNRSLEQEQPEAIARVAAKAVSMGEDLEYISSRKALSLAAKELNQAIYTVSYDTLPEPLRALRMKYDNAQRYLNDIERQRGKPITSRDSGGRRGESLAGTFSPNQPRPSQPPQPNLRSRR